MQKHSRNQKKYRLLNIYANLQTLTEIHIIIMKLPKPADVYTCLRNQEVGCMYALRYVRNITFTSICKHVCTQKRMRTQTRTESTQYDL